MSDPVTAGLALGIGGTVAGGVGSFLNAPSGPKVAELPPELELEQIRILQNQISAFEQESARTSIIADNLQSRANIYTGLADGLIPEQAAIQAINKQNEEIARNFGQEALRQVQLLSNDQEEQLDRNLRDTIRAETQRLAGADPLAIGKDPRVEAEITRGRAQLEEELARRYGPGYADTEAGRRAFLSFEEGAQNLRFNSARERSDQLGRLSNIAGQTEGQRLAQNQQRQSFAQFLLGGREASVNQLGQATNLGLQAESLGQQAFANAAQIGQSGVQLSQIPFSTLQSFGNQNISGTTRNLLESGRVGPGSVFQQTGGISRGKTGQFRELVSSAENQITSGRLRNLNVGRYTLNNGFQVSGDPQSALDRLRSFRLLGRR